MNPEVAVNQRSCAKDRTKAGDVEDETCRPYQRTQKRQAQKVFDARKSRDSMRSPKRSSIATDMMDGVRVARRPPGTDASTDLRREYTGSDQAWSERPPVSCRGWKKPAGCRRQGDGSRRRRDGRSNRSLASIARWQLRWIGLCLRGQLSERSCRPVAVPASFLRFRPFPIPQTDPSD